jgi:AraC family transcriptional regulator of arabinose operon
MRPPRPPESGRLISFRQPSGPRASRVTGAGYIYDKQLGHEVHDRTLGEYAIVYLLEGGGWFCDPLGRRAVGVGDLLVLFPAVGHSYFRGGSPRWSECWLMFRGPLFSALEADGLLERSASLLHPGLHPALVADFDDLIRAVQLGDPQREDVLAARCHLLLAELRRRHLLAERQRHGTDFVTLACARLEERLDQAVDLAQLAHSLGLSYQRFRTLFAQQVGTPPARYRQLRRIDRAKGLLAEGRLTLAEISRQLGYCDVYFFGRQFRRVAGQSPGRFRRAFTGMR